MPYVITDACENLTTREHGCREVCPTDSISGAPDDPQLYIDPDGCMDCGACSDECPNEAIFSIPDLPKEWEHFVQINADHFA